MGRRSGREMNQSSSNDGRREEEGGRHLACQEAGGRTSMALRAGDDIAQSKFPSLAAVPGAPHLRRLPVLTGEPGIVTSDASTSGGIPVPPLATARCLALPARCLANAKATPSSSLVGCED